MFAGLLKRSKLPRALQANDMALLLKAIRRGEPLDRPCSLPDQTDDSAKLPLEHALELGHSEQFQKLLEAGASAPGLNTLLPQAIQARQDPLSFISALLQAGADPNADHGAALFACLTLKDDNRVSLLLNRLQQYGADLNQHRHADRSLLEHLLLQQRQMLVGTLISAGAQLPASLDRLNCPDALKQFALRKAQDRDIAQQFLR